MIRLTYRMLTALLVCRSFGAPRNRRQNGAHVFRTSAYRTLHLATIGDGTLALVTSGDDLLGCSR